MSRPARGVTRTPQLVIVLDMNRVSEPAGAMVVNPVQRGAAGFFARPAPPGWCLTRLRRAHFRGGPNRGATHGYGGPAAGLFETGTFVLVACNAE